MSADICQGKYLRFLLPLLTGSLVHLEEFKFWKAPSPTRRDLGHSETSPVSSWYPIDSQYLSDPNFCRPCAGKCPTVFLMCQWGLSSVRDTGVTAALSVCNELLRKDRPHFGSLRPKVLCVFESLSYWFFPPELNLFQEGCHTHVSSPLKL